MPDHTALKVGDKIRLLSVPQSDLHQREREIRIGLENAGWTADTVRRIIEQNPIVRIGWIDEHGQPWFDCELRREDGTTENHSLAIMEDDSWERI